MIRKVYSVVSVLPVSVPVVSLPVSVPEVREVSVSVSVPESEVLLSVLSSISESEVLSVPVSDSRESVVLSVAVSLLPSVVSVLSLESVSLLHFPSLPYGM